MTRILPMAFMAAALLPAQTQIRDTGYTGISPSRFSGRLTIFAPNMTTTDGRTLLRWQQDFTITNGSISLDLEPNDTAVPSGTNYVARFTPSRGGASGEWSERWIVPTSTTPLKVNQIHVLSVPSPVVMVQPQQILSGGASSGQCLAWSGSSWGPIDCAAAGDAAVLSVFGRIGAVAPQSGDYSASQVTNALDATGNYVNPSWLSSLAWPKITGVPSFEPAVTGGSTNQYWRGDKTWQPISTAAVAEGINLYFTSARAQAAMAGLYESILTFGGALSRSSNTITCPTCLLSGGSYPDPAWLTLTQAGGRISGFEPTVATGTAVQYWRGDKTWQALPAAPARTHTVCLVAGGDDGPALGDVNLGPISRQYRLSAAATLVEITVAADGGTPNLLVGRNRTGAIVNLTSAALATAAAGGVACSNAGGTVGIDGVTTCSNTLQNTDLLAGDWIVLVSGTAGGVAKELTACLALTAN